MLLAFHGLDACLVCSGIFARINVDWRSRGNRRGRGGWVVRVIKVVRVVGVVRIVGVVKVDGGSRRVRWSG